MKKTILIVIALLLAFAAGYVLKEENDNSTSQNTDSTSDNSGTPRESASSDAASIAEIVSYTVPAGWEEASCDGNEARFLAPDGVAVRCNDTPAAPVTLSVNQNGPTDCNQLQDVKEVKKHTCISQFINGRKTLKASTEYLASSQYGKELSFSRYYIDTGKGIVLAEYAYEGDARFQSDFDTLVSSMQVK